MSRQSNLIKAKEKGDDDFYTALSDIKAELAHYTEYFQDKSVYCNCDNPEWSQFYTYFLSNFNRLKLKSVTFTFYSEKQKPYRLTISDNAKTCTRTELHDDDKHKAGDFASDECVKILDESDIIVTNPPFSLFRDYINLLHDHKKKFLIIGGNNAISYRDVFRLMMTNELWLGYGMPKYFINPTSFEKRSVVTYWYTNLGYGKKNKPIPLTKKYDPRFYPKYDNYDAINVDNIHDIPYDYVPEVRIVNSKEELDALVKELPDE